MPYLGLKGRGLLTGITCSSGMGFVIFGKAASCAKQAFEVSTNAFFTGYDDGVIGGLLTAAQFEDVFQLSSSMQGTVTSLFVIGCLVGCLTTGFTGGRWGRLTVAHYGAGFLSIGAIIQASSYSVAQLIVGRIVAGFGLGLITSNIPVWQSETASRKIRGTLVAISLTFLILGQVLAYWIDYAMARYESSVSWRFPMAFQAFLGIALSSMIFFMPECKSMARIYQLIRKLRS